MIQLNQTYNNKLEIRRFLLFLTEVEDTILGEVEYRHGDPVIYIR